MSAIDATTGYVDYPTIASPSFSPQTFANTLLLTTNNPLDTPLDLSTPLSRVLFDVQEVDTHIDALTTRHAREILEDTRLRAEAANAGLEGVEEAVGRLRESYARLEREVRGRYEDAERVRAAAEGMVRTLRLGRVVQRALGLGKQLESCMEEAGGKTGMVPAATVLVELRGLFAEGEVEGLERVKVVSSLRQDVVGPAERALLSRAQQVVREFSMSSLLPATAAATTGQQTLPTTTTTQTFAQTEETKARTVGALQTLYLLSPRPSPSTKTTNPTSTPFEPTLLLSSLQTYLQTALTASLATLSRALATLPTLDRACLEISARCQNILALETLLSTIRPPDADYLDVDASSEESESFLAPLLRHLDTSSLPSYFWRSLASQLSSRVQEILSKGGVSARTLRTNRERVREAVRGCVDQGSRLPGSSSGEAGRKEGGRGWEREAAVMVGSVMGPLGR